VFLLLARWAGKKVIVFFHGWDSGLETCLASWRLSVFREVYFRADAMIVLGREFRAKLRGWGYQGPIHLETTAVDEDLHASIERQKCRSETEGVNVLFLSRVTREKGIFEAIDAIRIARRTCPLLRMTIAGEGSALAGAKEYVRTSEAKGIEFMGWVSGEAKHDAFRRADIFLLPTQHGEGMPICLLEAMMSGLPIITCSAGGICDFFRHGRMGFLLEDRQPQTIARYVERLAYDAVMRYRMGEFNRMYALRHFSASQVGGRLHSIYEATRNGDREAEYEAIEQPLDCEVVS